MSTIIILGGVGCVVFGLLILLGNALSPTKDEEPVVIGHGDYMSDYYRRENERIATANKAYMFWSWANSVYLADLRANPPAEHFKLFRRPDGRWMVQEYDGVRTSSNDYFGLFSGYFVPQGPDGHHVYKTLGEPEGWLYREDAERFLSAYQRETETEKGYAK